MSCKSLFVIFALLVLSRVSLTAQESDFFELRIFFRQNSSVIERDYACNGKSVDAFSQILESVLSDSACVVDRVSVRAGASPEGVFDVNRVVCERRCKALALLVEKLYEGTFQSGDMVSEAVGIDWKRLDTLILAGGDPDRDEIHGVLRSCDSYIASYPHSIVGSPKKALMDLHGGRTWNRLMETMFPLLRTGSVTVYYTDYDKKRIRETTAPESGVGTSRPEQDTEGTEGESSAAPVLAEILTRKEESPETQKPRRVLFAPATNLLLPLLNVGLEVPLGDRFSVCAGVYYPWLGYDRSNVFCFQAALADVCVRWWFGGNNPDGLVGNGLAGHTLSLGAYGGLYDFETGGKGVQGEIGSVYLDYGYTFRIAEHCRLTLSAGLGFAHIPFRNYTVYSYGGKLIRDDVTINTYKEWFGPVRFGATLSFPIIVTGK